LRQQLAACKQTGTRQTLRASDRLFWSGGRACGLPAACLASRMPGLTAPCHAGLAIQRRLSVAPPVVTTSVSADKTGSPGTVPQYCPSLLHRTRSCIRPRERHGLRGRARWLRHGRLMGLCGSNERRDIFHTPQDVGAEAHALLVETRSIASSEVPWSERTIGQAYGSGPLVGDG
jgi:hypothetical protein